MKSVLKRSLLVLAFLGMCTSATATDRLFTYTYEPETMPQGGFEFEQWTTLRAIRNDAVGQDRYSRWDLRQEFEYGVTDYYTLSFYLNEKGEYFRDPASGDKTDEFDFDSVSIENKWMVLNPAEHPVGLTLYLEPRIADDEFELEEKIILGQRFGANKDWKWALNITHATEWKDAEEEGEEDETEGELEFSFGLAKELDNHWSLGIEFRNHNELPEYEEWENTVFYLGPVLSFHSEKWWAAVTVMGQVYGKNYQDTDPDGEPDFELEGHEYLNVRCIVGINF
jgi:hypothetical protein